MYIIPLYSRYMYFDTNKIHKKRNKRTSKHYILQMVYIYVLTHKVYPYGADEFSREGIILKKEVKKERCKIGERYM